MSERLEITRLDQARTDHLTRYMFAASRLSPGEVLDLGCGVGYGSYVMGLAGCKVTGIDICEDTILKAGQFFSHPNVTFASGDLTQMTLKADAATCFECIEHIEDPFPFLKNLDVKILFASVPNQDVVKWTPREKFHFRHYTMQEFAALLDDAGFKSLRWYHQNKETGVKHGDELWPGRSLVVEAYR